MADVGKAAEGLADTFIAQRDRIQARDAAVGRASADADMIETATTELSRIRVESDLSNVATTDAFGQFLTNKKAELLKAHTGGADSRALLEARLEARRAEFAIKAGHLGAVAGQKRIGEVLGQEMNRLSAEAIADPAALPQLFESLDASIADFAPGLPPESEFQFRSAGRRQIALSVLNNYLERGALDEARAVLTETPGLLSVLTPEQGRQLDSRFASAERAAREARFAGEQKLQELRTILGREPTVAERVRAAGVASDDGEQTPSAKIAGIEEALGRPLTVDERERVVDVGPAPAQTKAGKLVQDRELFISEYGEGSPQVKAFDEAAAKPDEAASLSDIGGIRKEFTKLSGVFVSVRDSFNRVTAAGTNPSPAGDLALIFNYMKILDPGSVVRESEFAQAASTGAFGERLQAAAERILSGVRLTDAMRADFISRAGDLMAVQLRSQQFLEAEFEGVAQRAGIDPADVLIDFIGPFRNATAAGLPATPARPVIHYDLKGNRIGGGNAKP